MPYDRASALLSAALRHVMDAERLLATSPDQSWHLAGFGPECARKACLRDGWLDRALGHELTAPGDAVLEVALALDVGASRYRMTGLGSRTTQLPAWRPDCRYERTGTKTSGQARSIVEEAADVVDEVACDLWMDGRVQVGV
jgi:hypothetical protein